MTISPSSSASNLSNVEDNGYLFRTAPADAAQAHFLVDLMGEEFGSDATVNVGVRNDDYGTGFESDFSEAWEAAGGTIGREGGVEPRRADLRHGGAAVGQREPRTRG